MRNTYIAMHLGYATFKVTFSALLNIQLNSMTVYGYTENVPRVINGTEAQPTQYPWVARMFVTKKRNSIDAHYLCTGSLIRTDFILTVSHCLTKNVLEVVVFMGDVVKRKETASNTKKSKRNYPHPCYVKKPTDRYDIGLVELDTPYELSPNVQVIALAEPSNDVTKWDGKNVVVVGWGAMHVWYDVETGKMVHTYTKHLLYSQERVIVRHNLARYGLSEDKRDWWLLRVVGDNTSMCTGDSGGPLLYEQGETYVQIAIARSIAPEKNGSVCIRDVLHQTYVRVDVHRDWIDKVLQEKRQVEVVCQKYTSNGGEGSVLGNRHHTSTNSTGSNAPNGSRNRNETRYSFRNMEYLSKGSVEYSENSKITLFLFAIVVFLV